MASGSLSLNWGVNETYKLLELWSKEPVQANLMTMKRNIDVYNQIASEMRTAGYQRTGFQCQSKIKKMKVVYRKLKNKVENNLPIGKKWQYYEVFDRVLGGGEDLPQVANILAEIMGRGGNGTGLEDGEESHEEELHENLHSSKSQSKDTVVVTEDGLGISDSSCSASPTHTAMADTSSLRASATSTKNGVVPASSFILGSAITAASRKRKRGDKRKVVGILSDLVQKVVEAKVKSDTKMVELEEKRLKLEERRMEREAELRREEREFQLRMLQCMMESQLCRPQEPTGSVVAATPTPTLPVISSITCPTSGNSETEVHMQF